MPLPIGVIAEDQSDLDVIDEILRKLLRKSYSVKSFLGRGSGRIVGKCGGWARVLQDQGCTGLIVVHDLDTAHLATLRGRLVAALGQCPISRNIIIIPVHEIEAWLLADEVALAQVAKSHKTVRPIANPERFPRPKEYLRDLLLRVSNRRLAYINTVHNREIAKHATISRLRRCESFRPLERFILENLR